VTLEIFEDSITLDVTGSDPQTPSALNATRDHSFAALAYVTKCLLDENILINDGYYRALSVAGPAGLVVTATRPAAVVGAWEVGQQLVETMWQALAPALPKRVPAGSKGIICNLGWGGDDPLRGEFYCYMETVGGGNGARPAKDGPDAIQTTIHNTENAPIEEVEINYPIRFARYGLITNSGGSGRFRGGLGIRRDFEFPDCDTTFTVLSDGTRFPPWGLEGGGNGRPARFIRDPEGKAERLPSKVSITVPKGGRVSVQTPGGGGHGHPHERDPDAVVRDVRDRKITPRAARETYGVVYNARTWTVDIEATQGLRKGLERSANS
jgi:N-methylhydantoinase B